MLHALCTQPHTDTHAQGCRTYNLVQGIGVVTPRQPYTPNPKTVHACEAVGAVPSPPGALISLMWGHRGRFCFYFRIIFWLASRLTGGPPEGTAADTAGGATNDNPWCVSGAGTLSTQSVDFNTS